jgi:hypothetical protein
MTRQQIADLRTEFAALRAELRHELANIMARLDALERPKIARVVINPAARFLEPGDGS